MKLITSHTTEVQLGINHPFFKKRVKRLNKTPEKTPLWGEVGI